MATSKRFAKTYTTGQTATFGLPAADGSGANQDLPTYILFVTSGTVVATCEDGTAGTYALTAGATVGGAWSALVSTNCTVIFGSGPPPAANGVTGPQGATGSQGSQGAQGSIGSGTQGSQGATGTQGSQGATGSQGSQGAAGSQGSQGSQGATGSQGAQGPQGVHG
jgi:hypothetical protein